MTFSKFTLACGFAVLSVAVLAVAPSTGWVVRRQLTGQGAIPHGFSGQEEFSTESWQAESAANAKTAARYPDDYPLSLAFAIADEANQDEEQSPCAEALQKQQVLTRLWNLRPRFARQPSLHANYLRFACSAAPQIGRDIEQEFLKYATLTEARAQITRRQDDTPPRGPAMGDDDMPSAESSVGCVLSLPSRWKPDPTFAARFLNAAREGERLEPSNGFFPLLQASALFARNQDHEAIAALKRASAKPDWNDYTTDETVGAIRLAEASSGRLSSAQCELKGLFINYSYLVTLRQTVRVALALAILREQQGDAAGGLQIRQALARLGMHLRVTGRQEVLNELGISITQMAGLRPGGVAPSLDAASRPILSRAYRDPYIQYLSRVGQKNEAIWYAEESRAGSKLEQLQERERQKLRSKQISVEQIVTLLWLAGSFVLVPFLWVLFLGALGARLTASPRVREGLPLPREGRWAFVAAVGAFITASISGNLAFYLSDGTSYRPAIVVAGLATLVCCIGPLPLFRKPPRGGEWNRQQRRERSRAAAKNYGKTLGAIIFCALLFGLPVQAFVLAPCHAVYSMLPGMWAGETSSGHFDQWCHWMINASLLSVPVAAIGGAIISARRRVPVSVGLARAAQTVALPIASSLLLLFAATVVVTARGEVRLRDQRTQRYAHEGRYRAAAIEETWPGVTPEILGEKP